MQAEITAGVPSERVVVAGFSQGGAAALLMLRSDIKLGAVVGGSTWPLHPCCQNDSSRRHGCERIIAAQPACCS